jgi:hypothetical protein
MPAELAGASTGGAADAGGGGTPGIPRRSGGPPPASGIWMQEESLPLDAGPPGGGA